MTPADWRSWVVALDLDDTLYKEADYRVSGLRAVADVLNALTGRAVHPKLDSSDALAELCADSGLTERSKESLLWLYRLHSPSISLDEVTSKVVEFLDSVCRRVVIVTDGRAVTQRLKLQALGLGRFPAYISEDYGADKPHPARYEQIMADYPGCRYVYVGDNPKKDFLAPRRLRWSTLGVRGDDRNIHASLAQEGFSAEYHPDRWLHSMGELPDVLVKLSVGGVIES